MPEVDEIDKQVAMDEEETQDYPDVEITHDVVSSSNEEDIEVEMDHAVACSADEDSVKEDKNDLELSHTQDTNLECPTQESDDEGPSGTNPQDNNNDDDDNDPKDAGADEKLNEFDLAELTYSQEMARARFLLDPDRRVQALSEQRYHLPNNNWFQDWLQYFANNHPLFGICFHYPDHPIGWPMRIMCFLASAVFGLAITNAFWLWARNNDNNSTLFTVETGSRPGANLTGYVVDVNEDNDVEVTQDIILLWTVGGVVHGMFDNLIWTLSICACCNPGGRFELLAKYKKFGIGLLTFFILLVMAVTSLSVVLRGVMEEDDEAADVKELKTAGVFDDAIDLRTSSKENYEFLMSFFVELALEFAVYFPLIGTLLFSGLFAFLRLPQCKGRNYEMEQEQEELQEVMHHPELYESDVNWEQDEELEDEPCEMKPDGQTPKSIWDYFKRQPSDTEQASEAQDVEETTSNGIHKEEASDYSSSDDDDDEEMDPTETDTSEMD